MEELTAEQSEHLKAIQEVIPEIQNAQDKIAASTADYWDAEVTVSLSVGPAGANLHGWITYRNDRGKIYFKMTRTTAYAGLGFGGGGFLPRVPVLKPELLGGQTGEVFVVGSDGGGLVTLLPVNGRPVTLPIPVAGVGIGPWGFRGDVKYEVRS